MYVAMCGSNGHQHLQKTR